MLLRLLFAVTLEIYLRFKKSIRRCRHTVAQNASRRATLAIATLVLLEAVSLSLYFVGKKPVFGLFPVPSFFLSLKANLIVVIIVIVLIVRHKQLVLLQERGHLLTDPGPDREASDHSQKHFEQAKPRFAFGFVQQGP